MKKNSGDCFQIVSGLCVNYILLIIRDLRNAGRIPRKIKAFNPSKNAETSQKAVCCLQYVTENELIMYCLFGKSNLPLRQIQTRAHSFCNRYYND